MIQQTHTSTHKGDERQKGIARNEKRVGNGRLGTLLDERYRERKEKRLGRRREGDSRSQREREQQRETNDRTGEIRPNRDATTRQCRFVLSIAFLCLLT